LGLIKPKNFARAGKALKICSRRRIGQWRRGGKERGRQPGRKQSEKPA